MTETEFTTRQERYIGILADPKEKRTQGAIAKAVGVTRKTLYEWRKLPGFWAARDALVKDNTDRRMTQVWDALLLRAERGDVQAARLVFQLRGELVERLEQKFQGVFEPATIFIDGVEVKTEDRHGADISQCSSGV